MPQVLMLTHAAHVNSKRRDADLKKKAGDRPAVEDSIGPQTDGDTFHGKPIDQLNSQEYLNYLNS